MQQIGSKNTTPEIIVRQFLHAKGFRYSLHSKKLPGKPDLTLTKYQTVVFVHGCFWHGHRNCKDAKIPATNKKFWIDKIANNKKRDTQRIKELKNKNWKVLIIWECELKKDKAEKTFTALVNKIKN